MSFDWSTFVLEILNFLVLVWILKRFLYGPVLDAARRRGEAVRASLAEAQDRQSEALALKAQYEDRQAQWARERDAARAALDRELQAERLARLESLRAEIASERETQRVSDERRFGERVREQEARALGNARAFVSRLFASARGSQLHERLVDLALDELAALPPGRAAEIARGLDAASTAAVASAYPLDAARQARLDATLAALAGRPIRVVHSTDESLLCGIVVVLGPWTLAANLRDELHGFADLAHDA
ncbi:MAG: F0F1 ATP synthase subunit delta [Gammaproteobacteria bacterium]